MKTQQRNFHFELAFSSKFNQNFTQCLAQLLANELTSIFALLFVCVHLVPYPIGISSIGPEPKELVSLWKERSQNSIKYLEDLCCMVYL